MTVTVIQGVIAAVLVARGGVLESILIPIRCVVQNETAAGAVRFPPCPHVGLLIRIGRDGRRLSVLRPCAPLRHNRLLLHVHRLLLLLLMQEELRLIHDGVALIEGLRYVRCAR